MANITNYLNKIKTAVYGKDVRGAIHDAIKQVYDDASVNHDNANMEVKMARGTHNTLNDRLDNVDEIQTQTNAQLSDHINKKPLKFHYSVIKGDSNSNCAIIEFSNGKNMFIDVGNSTEWNNIKRAIDSLGITKFDYGIITHTHWDHIGNLDNFLTTYDCSECTVWRQAGADFTNPNLIENEDDFNAVWEIFKKHNITPIIPPNNSYITIDEDTLLHLLNTEPTWIDTYYSAQTEYRDRGSNFNNWSIVCEIIHKNVVILTTGDIETVAQDKIAPYIRKADLMTAPHHACNRNLSKKFFHSAFPRNVVIPVNKKSLAEYNAQYKEFMWYKDNSVDIIATCNTGDLFVTYESDGHKINCKTIAIPNVYTPIKNYSSIYEVVPAYGLSNATVDMRLNTILSHMNIGDTLRCNVYNDMNLFGDLKQLFNRDDFTNGVEVEIFKRQNQNCYTIDLREMTYSMRAITKTAGSEWYITGSGYLGYVNGIDNLADLVSKLPIGHYTINYKALSNEDLYGNDNYNIAVDVLASKQYAMLTAIPRSDNKLSVYFGVYNYQFTKNKILWNHSAINKWDIGYMTYGGKNMSAQNTTTPITGAMVLGKSIFNLLSVANYELGHINGTTGENIASANRFRTKNIVMLSSNIMTIKCYDGLQVRQIIMYQGTNRVGSSAILNKTSHSFEVDTNVDGVRIVFSKIDDSNITISNDLKCMLFAGNYEDANIPFLGTIG